MPTGFLTLPREIRDKIYELCLLVKGSIHPWDGFDEEELQELSLGLFYTNKTISYEAGLILYQNQFDFTKADPEEVSSFLEKIGRSNADSIRHVVIEFPSLTNLELGSVAIHEYYVGILASIQSHCTNLETLTTSRRTTDDMESTFNRLDDPEIVTKALTLVNTQFRAISSLQDIIVKVFETPQYDHIRKQFEDQGWIVDSNDYDSDWNSDASGDDSDRSFIDRYRYNAFLDNNLRRYGYRDDLSDDDSDSDL
ncbi:hypothetical protein V492_07446 [Pseudogymnoascus sp. VKM F-4246]|nr:hypothetical protein V492_07446 [Pseudogymnoascus sp. VKM F-4246]